jgi:predicted acyltransferase
MEKQSGRWVALDAFRGLVIFLMLPVNAAMDFAAIPAWFKHAPAEGATMPDFIMPAFLVALGLSSSLSLRRRIAAGGAPRTWGHALLRYGLLFLFGTIGFFLVWKQRNWEILQMLGATGALAFPFLFLPPPWRLASASALLLAVEALRPAFFDGSYRAWYESGIGGPAGTFALAALPIAASALGELLSPKPWKERALIAVLVGGILAAAGLLASLAIPLNKHLLSISYLLLTFGASLLALAAIELIVAAAGREPPLVGALGRNALFAYMAGGVLTLGIQALLPPGSAAWIAWAASLLVLAVIAAATRIMDAKRIWIKL